MRADTIPTSPKTASADTPTLRQWLAEAPFALAMSSGFFGFFAHCGVLTVLEEEGLLPNRVAGSSAGALTAGLWAAGVDASTLADQLLSLKRLDFWDPAIGPGLLRGQLFRQRLQELLPVTKMEAARVPMAISTYDVLGRTTRVLTEGSLAKALHASCAVPFLFRPVWHEGRLLADGGIADRPGLQGLEAEKRILFHHLSSRSPWRRRGDPGLRIPRREGLTTLVVDGLPRVGPFRLQQGTAAFKRARRQARTALDQPMIDGLVRTIAGA